MEILCSPAIATSQQYVVTLVKRRYGIHHITTFTQGMFKPVQKRLCNLAVGTLRPTSNLYQEKLEVGLSSSMGCPAVTCYLTAAVGAVAGEEAGHEAGTSQLQLLTCSTVLSCVSYPKGFTPCETDKPT